MVVSSKNSASVLDYEFDFRVAYGMGSIMEEKFAGGLGVELMENSTNNSVFCFVVTKRWSLMKGGKMVLQKFRVSYIYDLNMNFSLHWETLCIPCCYKKLTNFSSGILRYFRCTICFFEIGIIAASWEPDYLLLLIYFTLLLLTFVTTFVGGIRNKHLNTYMNDIETS